MSILAVLLLILTATWWLWLPLVRDLLEERR